MQGHNASATWLMQSKNSGGFTIIELIIALAVIIIVTGAVFLAFRQPERRALEHASRQLQADIRYARRRAVIGGRPFAVFFEPAEGIGGRYRVMALYPVEEIRAVYFTDGVRLRYSTSPQLVFHPRGTPTGGFSINLSSRYGCYWQRLTSTVSGGRIEIFAITY